MTKITKRTKPATIAKAKERILIKTCVGKLLFPCLVEPETREMNLGKYHTTLLITKEDWKSKEACKVMRENILKAGRAYFGDSSLKLTDFNHPFKNGDEKEQEYMHGHIVVAAKSDFIPKVVGPDRKELSREQIATIKGGDYGLIVANAYGYNRNGNTGISLGLQVVQFARPGEAIGGGAAAALEMLDEMEVEVDGLEDEDLENLDAGTDEVEDDDDGIIV